MKEPSLDAAVYAAGLVFAPDEDDLGSDAAAYRPGKPPVSTAQTRQKPQPITEDYQVRYRAASASDKHAYSNWARSIDFSWLLGRATA